MLICRSKRQTYSKASGSAGGYLLKPSDAKLLLPSGHGLRHSSHGWDLDEVQAFLQQEVVMAYPQAFLDWEDATKASSNLSRPTALESSLWGVVTSRPIVVRSIIANAIRTIE